MAIDGGLSALFQSHLLPSIHWQRVETGGTGAGIPDINGCLNGCEFWVEFKKTNGWAVRLAPEQVGWILRRGRAGGHVFVAVRRTVASGPRRVAADSLYLFAGRYARELATVGLRSTPALGCWHGGPSNWAWDTVLAKFLESY